MTAVGGSGPAAASAAAPAPGGLSVAAVIVTYNRRDLLLESLAAVAAQERPPDSVIVVDNASTDGTAAAVAASAPSARLISLDRNYGGAGGFAYGIALGLAGDADLIWLMDDDTVPEPGALQAMLEARSSYGPQPPALIASRVVWTDGRPHPMNTPRAKPMASRAERTAAQAAGCVPIRSASFVSILIDAALCRQRGLPVAEFFLWNDDFEFTTRLLRGKHGLLCPASVVVHKTAKFGSASADPGDRFFYEVRNKIWTLRTRSLTPLERVLYGGATLRRWAQTFAGSADKGALRSALRRGLVAGLSSRPRPNAEVVPELATIAGSGTGSGAVHR
jgi:rhamnopyranosyl-N-acetylglucosaminyl-diphospho-decaprenol beta-1,3/1,4-galactofuranosyltransferase